MDILTTIDKYEKLNLTNSYSNLQLLKKFFNSDFLNYSNNPNSVEINSEKQFLSLRKSKIVKDYDVKINYLNLFTHLLLYNQSFYHIPDLKLTLENMEDVQ